MLGYLIIKCIFKKKIGTKIQVQNYLQIWTLCFRQENPYKNQVKIIFHGTGSNWYME